jgi:hypothetical protein
MASGPKPSSARAHNARSAYYGPAHVATCGLPGLDRRPSCVAHKTASPARAQCLGALEHAWERTWLARQPVVGAPCSTVA